MVRLTFICMVFCACASTPVYHTIADVSDHCKQAGHRVFDPYADCINQTLKNQFGFDNDGVASTLEKLRQEMRAKRSSDAAAIAAFEARYHREIEPVDWQGGLRTALAVGAVVGVVALIAASASTGFSTGLPELGPDYLERRSLGGCCSWHGGLARTQITGQAAQCADGTQSRTCFFDGARLHQRSQPPDHRGCCSWHDGICGFAGDAVVCCDLEVSPRCRVR